MITYCFFSLFPKNTLLVFKLFFFSVKSLDILLTTSKLYTLLTHLCSCLIRFFNKATTKRTIKIKLFVPATEKKVVKVLK